MDDLAEECVARITMLGNFTMEIGGHVLSDDINRSQKLWNVLAYLIIHRGRKVPQAEFMERFWPEEQNANPASALKTLLYRVRAMLEPFFGEGVEPILSQRGSYSWNNEIPCKVDIDEFETLCLEAGEAEVPADLRLELRRQVDKLYQGEFLPKLAGQLWVIPITARLHSLYIENVRILAEALEARGEYEAMNAVASRAAQIDPLDESVHILVVRSLLCQGKNAAALNHYNTATDLLYRSLGLHPSKELRELYRELMNEEQGLETDLEVIQADLREAAARNGAFVCGYGFFKEAYRLEARRAIRNGASVHVSLITVSLPDGSMPALKLLASTMDQLLQVLVSNLRQGDVVSKYSGAQYVIMLPSANFEDSTMVLERIIGVFTRQHRRNFLKLSYKIRALD